MANIAWPDSAIPSDFTLSRYTKVFRGTSLFGKSGQNLDTVNDRWLAKCSISIRDRDAAAELEAFVNKLRGGSAVVLCYHFARPVISGVLTNPTTIAMAMGVQNLTLNCAAGDYLKAGDMLGIGDQLFQTAFDCAASGTTITVPLTMRSRKPIAGSVAVTTVQPTGKFRLVGVGSTTFSPGGITMGTELELVEVIN